MRCFVFNAQIKRFRKLRGSDRVSRSRDAVTRNPAPRIQPAQAKRPTLDLSLSMLAMHRRDMILQAIARSAHELLRSSDVTQSIPKVLELIGIATDVERVHMLLVDSAEPLEARDVIGHYLWA